ncbi:MAG: stage II sporulation protein M [Deltaproteobacteria bacterium]|nr:stage II sporulation protein M [Deltaproteobacteria bacterium]
MPAERLLLETPERVGLDLEIVGLGPRALAFMLDAFILFLWWIFAVFVLGLLTRGDAVGWYEGLSDLIRTLLFVAIFAVNWGYGLIFEWAWNGQTPGKRVVGLRVVRRDGRPYDLVTSAVRNLSRLVDGFPLNTYAIGLTTVAVTTEHRRLGDLLAGTVLVRDAPPDLSVYGSGGGVETEGLERIAPLEAQVYETVADYLDRREHLDPAVREKVARATLEIVLSGSRDPAGERSAAGEGGAAIDAYLRRRMEASRATRRGAGVGAAALLHFVARRREDWEHLADALDRLVLGRASLADLEDLDNLYRQSSRDLAWVQTRYPGSTASRYLQGLCARAYREVYRGTGDRREAFRAFWRRDFPLAVWDSLPQVQLATFLLALGALTGALLVHLDPAVADDVLGPALMETVRSGRVWTDDLLSVAPPSLVSARIFTNNLSVTIAAFAGGLTFGVWTIVLLILNGALLGVAFAATAMHGVSGNLLDFIAAHGPVELSVIVLASAAGLKLAVALLLPGELPRGDALKTHGRTAVRIVLGGAPLLVGVGLIEGFVSPGSFFPTWLKATLGLGLGVMVWVYLLRFGRRAWLERAAGAARAPEVW